MDELEEVDPERRNAQMEELFARMAESERWAKLEISLDEATEVNRDLCADLSRFSRLQAVALLSALLTLPEYQSTCIRLELLVALAVMHCHGQKTPNLNDVARWYLGIGKSPCVGGEDPAEDVFVTLIQTEEADYRMLEGIWESAGFYTQRVDLAPFFLPRQALAWLGRQQVALGTAPTTIWCQSLRMTCREMCLNVPGLAAFHDWLSDGSRK